MSDLAESWAADAAPVAERPTFRSRLVSITQSPFARRLFILALLALIWELAARHQNNPIMLPGFLATARAFVEGVTVDNLLGSTVASLTVLLKGYVLAIAIAITLVSIAVANSFARDVLTTLTAMFNPLPAIALLPIAMLWFGLGEKSLIFVLVHSVVWPFALAALSGFETVPETLRLVGRNYGLRGPAYVARILIPAALPAILSGLRIGWAFAWRTLIAAELVFGVTARQGGLGWFIFQNRNELYTDKVFAGLAAVILIGLLVDAVVFRAIEAATVRRWGTQR
ncbi:ABC transporter permease [Methylopila sp. M107]|uniref:ABC transporter permease n=1 Tax=Methylopila sp. M107 TaxID=1101190 RepID=UPI000370FBA6|nr:ABC transporter permease [Methylopila sp. M107]